jgi:hypothetical protein
VEGGNTTMIKNRRYTKNPFWRFNIWFDRLPNAERDLAFLGILGLFGLIEYGFWWLVGVPHVGILFFCLLGMIRILYHLKFHGGVPQ